MRQHVSEQNCLVLIKDLGNETISVVQDVEDREHSLAHRDAIGMRISPPDILEVPPVRRKFGTLASDLEQLANWLAERQVKEAVMESTAPWRGPKMRGETYLSAYGLPPGVAFVPNCRI
jgi:hypothetical protein